MKRLLIVVDYQNDFVCGSLGFDKAKELEKGILENAIASITVDKINATYLLGAIERAKTKSKYLVDGINPLKFNNFKAREYDYDSLEKKLLGWDKQEDVIEEEQLPLGIGWLGV